MDIHLSYQKAAITGNPDKGGWMTVVEERPGLELRQTRGQLFLVFDLTGPRHFEAEKQGLRLLKKFSTGYFKDTAEPLSTLKKEATILVEDLKNLALEQKIDLEFNLEAALLWGNMLYLLTVGEGAVLLKRGQLTARLLPIKKSSLPEEGPIFSVSSGQVHDKDLLLITNPKLVKAIGWEKLASVFEDKPIEKLLEDYKAIINQTRESAAGLALKFVMEAVPDAQEEGLKTTNLDELEKRPKLYLKRGGLGSGKSRLGRKKLRRILVGLVLVIFLFLVLSLTAGLRSRRQAEKETEVEQLLSRADQQLKQAKSLKVLNPVRARQLLTEAQTLVEKASEKAEQSKKEKTRTVDLAALIKEAWSEIGGLHQLSPTPWLDINLIKEGQTGVDWSCGGSQECGLVLSDGTVLSVNLNTKNHRILGRVEGAWAGTTSPEGAYVLTDKGIFRVEEKGEKKITNKDFQGKEAVDLIFYGGNLYVLSKLDNQIYKFTAGGQDFWSGKKWLADKVETDSQVKALTIDGSIYTASEKEIVKYFRGRKENFWLQDLEAPLEKATDIFTSENNEFLYILEPKRLIKTNKKGVFKASYSWEEPEAEKVTVNKEESKAFLLKGSLIYEIDL